MAFVPFSLFTLLVLFSLLLNPTSAFNPKLLNVSKLQSSTSWSPAGATWYGSPTGAGSDGKWEQIKLTISHIDTIFGQNMTFVPDNVLDFFIILPCRGCLWIWNCRRPSTILFNGVCWRTFFIQFRQRMWSLLSGASPYVSLEKYRYTWIKFGSKPAWSHLF